MKLIIGNQNYSSWSMRPWVAMTHFGIEFETSKLELFTPTFHEQVARYSSAKTVPILVTEDGVATDSLAILETLADRYPNMWPNDPSLKILGRNIVAQMHSGFNALRSEMPMNCRAYQRQLVISEACRSDIDQVEALFARCIEAAAQKGQTQGYLLGEFSIADAFFAPVIVRLRGYKVSVNDATKSYMQTVLSNPAVKAWIGAGLEETSILIEDEAGTD